MRGWFTVDVLSCLPVNYITLIPGVDAEAGKGNKMFRMLRLLRLLKLLRLARLNRLIARYEQEYYHLVSSFKILKVVLIVGCISHWMCCAWFAAGSQESQFVDGEGNMLQGWVNRHFGGESNATGMAQYSIALYWAMMTMTTVGYGDISPQTEVEYWFVTFAMLLGGFVFGMIVGFLGDMSKDANPEESLRTRSAALLNALLIRQDKHPELIRRVRNFKAHHDSVQTAMDTLGMMKSMPWSLTSELAISMQWIDGYHGHDDMFRPGIVHRVPFFQGLSEMSTITICSRMKHILVRPSHSNEHSKKRDYIFEAGDIGHEMFIVLEGLILVEEAPPSVNGKLEVSPSSIEPIGALKDGDFFGENGILVRRSPPPPTLQGQPYQWGPHMLVPP